VSQTQATYRAIQAVAPGRLELVEKPLVAPSPGHVRICVEACGVCHSDAATVEGGLSDPVATRARA
jgi:propanol-preferring alcohol dehydrogenase